MTIGSTFSRDLLSEAVGHLNGGAPAEAVKCLHRALAVTPRNPVALTLMGVALLEAGDVCNAELHLRRALSISPERPEILYYLAKAARLAGRPAEAVSLCRAALSLAADYDDALVELAAAYAATGAFENAIEVYRRIVARHPQRIEARRALAASLVQVGRPAEAERVLREALALPITGDTAAMAEVRSELGDILMRRRAFEEALAQYVAVRPCGGLDKRRAAVLQHLRRFDEAVNALKAAVTSDPLDMDAHLQLNELLHRQGRDQDFLRSYDEAACLLPDSTLPLVTKGRLLLKIGKPEIANDYFERTLKRSPDDLGALVGRARTLEALGQVSGAREIYERALRTGAADPGVLVDASSFFLRHDAPDRAEHLAEQALAVNPSSQEALSLLTLCYRTLDDEREFGLAGYDSLVRVFDLGAPSGVSDMAAFNRELATYLASLHCDAREHFTQTLRGGTRLYDAIFHNGHALVDRLQPEIDRAIARYVREIPAAAPGVFRNRRGKTFNYVASWSSRLAERGFHTNHIHSEGWISSVYYVSVPDVCENAEAREGWLKFGEPTPDFGSRYGPRRLVQPKPGRLVLFPSYLWHGTTSFTGSQQRMTIAFDVAPGSQQH